MKLIPLGVPLRLVENPILLVREEAILKYAYLNENNTLPVTLNTYSFYIYCRGFKINEKCHRDKPRWLSIYNASLILEQLMEVPTFSHK